MRAPSGPKPARLAIAQLPANAAPNTSALIRIAALTTVSTFGQRMRRRRGVWDSRCSFECVGTSLQKPRSMQGAIYPLPCLPAARAAGDAQAASRAFCDQHAGLDQRRRGCGRFRRGFDLPTSGGRTTARGRRPSSTSASFMRGCACPPTDRNRTRGPADRCRSLTRRASARSLALTAWRNSSDCRSAMTLPEPERSPLQPRTSELISHQLCVESIVDLRLAEPAARERASRVGPRCRTSP